MTVKDKRINRLLSLAADYKYDEFRTLMIQLGYSEDTKGNTSGSRVAFVKSDNPTCRVIYIHKPHPPGKPIFKHYLKEIIKVLEENGDI